MNPNRDMDMSSRSKSQFSNQNVMVRSQMMVDKIKKQISYKKGDNPSDPVVTADYSGDELAGLDQSMGSVPQNILNLHPVSPANGSHMGSLNNRFVANYPQDQQDQSIVLDGVNGEIIADMSMDIS